MVGRQNPGRRTVTCTLWTCPRHVCYMLVACVVFVCIADLLCLSDRLSRTSTWRDPNLIQRLQVRKIAGLERCATMKATLEALENEALEFERKLWNLSTKASKVNKVTKGHHAGNSVFRYNLVIAAYKRSGSSFVGQLFNQHPDILYFYEPKYFLKELERIHGDIHRTLSRHLLRTIFTCSFDGNPYFVSQLSDSAFRLYSRPLSDIKMCPRVVKNLGNLNNECKRLDANTLTEICQSYRHVVVKSIRIEDLEELRNEGGPKIDAPWNILKILHLVRDPRAIISSRATIATEANGKNWTMPDYKENSRVLCTKMLRDLKSGASRAYNGMYDVVRYEDIVTQPEYAVKELFNFINLPSSEEVWKWLHKNSQKHSSYAFSTAKNVSISLNRWRLRHDLETIRIVEQECSIIMTLMGYLKARDLDHLINVSQPLYLRNKLSDMFITRNISNTLHVISRLKDMGML